MALEMEEEEEREMQMKSLFAAATLAAALTAGSAQLDAALISVEFTSRVVFVPAATGEFEIGDTFSASLVYDDSVADSEPYLLAGRFENAVTSFSFSANPGNTGTWTPAPGAIQVPADAFADYDLAVRFGLSAANGLPTYNGNPFHHVNISFDQLGLVDYNQTTLRDQLGGPLPGDIGYYSGPQFDLAFETGPNTYQGVDMEIISLSVRELPSTDVPEPGTMLLLGSALALAGWRRRR